MSWQIAGWVSCLLLAACLLIAACRHAPVNDEFGHFYAGLCYWQLGDTEVFKVNPPLVRSLAALPAYAAGFEVAKPPAPSRYQRPEFLAGRKAFIAEPERFQRYLTIGRLIVVALTLCGAWMLVRSGQSVCGDGLAGLLACLLWLGQPQVLGHGGLITGDVACAVAMLATVRIATWAAQQLTPLRAAGLGVLLGISVLSKFTALVLVPVMCLHFVWQADRISLRRMAGCAAICCGACLAVVAVPYGFQDWGQSLAKFQFVSFGFIDLQVAIQKHLPWSDVWLRVPLPEQFLLGMDRQQLDFEQGLISYAAGLRGIHGWWWFYLYSMCVKLPVGTLLCIAVTALALAGKWRQLSAGLGLPMLMLAAMILATCLQDGFAQQHRYILPAYPFLFLIIGVVGGRALSSSDRLWRIPLRRFGQAVVLGVGLTVVGCLSASPNWLSAFNCLAGGNTSGFMCLFNDASDWGQDTYRVRDWINAHAASGPIHVRSSFSGHAELRAVGTVAFEDARFSVEEMPRPSWLVVSKSDYAIDASLENQLDGLSVTEWIGGTHVVYFFDERRPESLSVDSAKSTD